MNDTLLFEVTYNRDAAGRLTGLTETAGGTVRSKGYTYDLAGQLKEVRENGTLAAVYEYDSNGNRSRVTRPSGVTTGTYDTQDRLLSYGSATYAYTRNGELSTKTVTGQTTQYVHDALGNLRNVTLPDGRVIEYVIDGMNRRIGKKVNGVLVQGFLYQDHINPIAELDAAGNLVSRFVYGSRRNLPDYVVKNGVTYRLLSDHLGSVRFVVEVVTGAVAQRIDYDEFGNVTENTNPGFQPFGYASGLIDDYTGLIRFGVRDYDASVGRWTAKDPAGLVGSGRNLYSYTSNAPVDNTDPTGMQPGGSECRRYQTRYAHLSKLCVYEGQHVDRGNLIGISGKTGMKGIRPHLHFEVRLINKGDGVENVNTTAVEPLTGLQAMGLPFTSYGVEFGSKADFGPRGVHPTTRVPNSFHKGVDFPFPTGSMIHTLEGGTVVVADYIGKLGNVVYVNHPCLP